MSATLDSIRTAPGDCIVRLRFERIAEQWKAFSPFAGVLTRDELDGLRWTSRH